MVDLPSMYKAQGSITIAKIKIIVNTLQKIEMNTIMFIASWHPIGWICQ